MKTVNIGLIGAGTVGKGVAEGIAANGELIAERSGAHLVIKGVCDTDKAALKGVNAEVKTAKAEDLITDKDIDVIVELIGGVSPAKEIVLAALKNKKHVVTANKALLSECGEEIFAAAAENGVFVNFEASVGGGIPVIRAMRESFVANDFSVAYGILNGTTNFILTMMDENDQSFADALAVAQEKGIAEADPELDISGKDSAHKLAILSLLAYGISVLPDDIYTEGIEMIEPIDIEYAAMWGYAIKLLAVAKKENGKVQLRVHPTLISSEHLLASVRGADNAIFVKGDLIGESLLYGKGAGSKPTASSVIGDIVDIAGHMTCSCEEDRLRYAPVYAKNPPELSRIEDLHTSYYLRFSAVDKPGVLAAIAKILADNGISIASVSQEEHSAGETVPVIILTHEAQEGDMMKAISTADALDFVQAKTTVIRIEE